MLKYFLEIHRTNRPPELVYDLPLCQSGQLAQSTFNRDDTVTKIRCYSMGETPLAESDENVEWIMS